MKRGGLNDSEGLSSFGVLPFYEADCLLQLEIIGTLTF